MATYHITSPSGEEYAINNPDDAKAKEAASQLADSFGPSTSTLGAAGRGALDALPFGDKAAAGIQHVVQGGSYDKYLKELDDYISADKEQHPVAHYAGEAAGTVAPFLIPGVGEALGADSLAGRAAVGGGIGAIQGASNNRNATQLPQDILKGAATGAVLNPAVGALGDTLGGLFRRGGSGIAKAASSEADALHMPPSAAPEAEKMSADAVAGAAKDPTGVPMEPSTDTLTAGRQKQGLFPSKEEFRAEVLAGQLGGSPRQLRSLPGKDPIQTLNHMYDVIRQNSTPENPLIGGADRYAERLNKFVDLQQRSGRVIGDTIKNAGSPPIATAPIKDAIQEAVKFPNPDDMGQMKSVMDTINKYAQADGNPDAITFQRLQQLKSDLGNEAFHGQGNKVLQAAYHAVDKVQEGELDRLGASINRPGFDQAKAAYQMTSRAIPMLKMATTRSLAKGYSSFGTPLAALVTGHPVAAMGSMLKEPIGRMMGAAVFNSGGGEVGSTAANVLGKSVTNFGTLLAHPAMAPFKSAFDKAAQAATDSGQVQKAHEVTDFILSQNTPAYSVAKKTATEAVQNAK